MLSLMFILSGLASASVEPCTFELEDAIVRIQYYDQTPVEQPLCVAVVDLPDTVQETLPAVVMLHGLGDAPSGWAREGVVQLWLEAMRTGELPPMRIVLPQGNEGYWSNQIEGEGRYRDWVIALMSQLERDSLITEDNNVLMGVSMGGYGALSLGLAYPNRFSTLLALSPTDLEIATQLQPNRPVYTSLFGQPIHQAYVAALEPREQIIRGAGHDQHIAIVVGDKEPSKFRIGVERLDLLQKQHQVQLRVRHVAEGCHCWASTWDSESQRWLIEQAVESLESARKENQ